MVRDTQQVGDRCKLVGGLTRRKKKKKKKKCLALLHIPKQRKGDLCHVVRFAHGVKSTVLGVTHA